MAGVPHEPKEELTMMLVHLPMFHTEDELEAHTIQMQRVPGLTQPTFKQLVKVVQTRGPDGVLEAATHLHEQDFERLVEVVARHASCRRRRR
jgi:hypothetical protein